MICWFETAGNAVQLNQTKVILMSSVYNGKHRTFLYDPPLVRYNDEKKIYEDYQVVDENSYTESTDLQDLLNGEGFD